MFSAAVSKLLRKALNIIKARFFRPRITVRGSGGQLVRLGSAYGGWTVEDSPYLRSCTAISCGLGEDASFDVEFASRYDARVIIVDPTPRSIVHFMELSERFGKAADRVYEKGGRQPVSSYDLSGITPSQLTLVQKALWINEQPITFYKPMNPSHVSHSIKFESAMACKENYIVVPTTTLPSLMKGISGGALSLLKMDIEGAEVDILNEICSWPTLPRQILVEFDVLREPGSVSRTQVERADAILRGYGYVCRHFDGDRNYLYVR